MKERDNLHGLNFLFSLLMDFIFKKCLILAHVILIWVPGLLWPLLQFGERQEDSERLDEKEDLQHLFLR